jgi:hypothetical protein
MLKRQTLKNAYHCTQLSEERNKGDGVDGIEGNWPEPLDPDSAVEDTGTTVFCEDRLCERRL